MVVKPIRRPRGGRYRWKPDQGPPTCLLEQVSQALWRCVPFFVALNFAATVVLLVLDITGVI